ncbi:MAG TPA: M14 family zinc carboxypeptidase [Candidatus Thermoplasmatota archaeon]|nr:M14 family zinc carboxypeptidase [Candidatus Thermoplasmatota archaeon]
MKINRKVLGIVICMLMITVAYPIVGANAPLSGPLNLTPHQMLVRVTTGSSATALPKGVELASENPGAWVDIVIPSNRLHELAEMDLSYSILIEDLGAYEASMAGSYHTLAQIQSILEGIAANHSDIATLYSIGTTYEGRDIWCLEISDNPGVDEGEPGVFFMGVHHAREWPSAEICLYIANNLTAGYGVNSTITDWVNSRRIWIVPVQNPDGYYYSHDLGIDWRKNRDYFPQYGTYGVDTNRNYDGSCDGNPSGAWGAVTSWAISHYPDNECYDGPGPTSELEDQAIASIFKNNNISACITYHTYGEEVMWPWGYTYGVTPDNTYISQVGQQIASRIQVQSGGGTYDPHQSVGLYPTVADTIDFAYGYSHYIQGHATFVYCIEACNEFQPPASYLNQICYQNCKGALYLLDQAQDIRDTVAPRVIPPVIIPMGNDSDGNYRVAWTLQNQGANPDAFQLSEMKGLSLETDDAESGSGFWTLDGFSLTTSKSYSGSYSYKATKNSDYQVSSMTSISPLPIVKGMTLSFWCWYRVEQNADYAYVEVSENGRTYDVLGSFTGSSGDWVNKQYSLDDYSGKSLFIRFRYCTDAYGHQDVFYIDDIAPIAIFNSITNLSSSITNTYYDITNQPLGIYYYCVRGHNTARGWCDNSTLQIINVTQGGGETYPVLQLGNLTLKPGKLSVSVKNVGTAEAKNVNMTLRVTGGVLGLIHKEKEVTLPQLAVNQTHTITTDGYLIGFGKIMIFASASCPEAVPPVVSENTTAKILLFFLML